MSKTKRCRHKWISVGPYLATTDEADATFYRCDKCERGKIVETRPDGKTKVNFISSDFRFFVQGNDYEEEEEDDLNLYDFISPEEHAEAAVAETRALATQVAKLHAELKEARSVAYCLSHAYLHNSSPLDSWIEKAQSWREDSVTP